MTSVFGVIYVGTNRINNKRYVGQTVNKPMNRINSHFEKAERSKKNHPLYNAIRKYGKENFDFEVIWHCQNQIELNICEQSFIELFDTMSPNGYNLREGGSKGKHSEESRRNIRDALAKPEVHERFLEGLRRSSVRRVEGVRAAFQREDVKQRHSDSLRKTFSRPEIKKKLIARSNRPDAILRATINFDIGKQNREVQERRIASTKASISEGNWINDGKVNKRLPKDCLLPDNWQYGRLGWEDIQYNMTKAAADKISGSKWANNGVDEKRVKVDQIPAGWVFGRIGGTRWVNNGNEQRRIKADQIPVGWVLGKIR